MDDDDIYICFPGELVVYLPVNRFDQNAGLLCTVKGIKKGKVELSIVATDAAILANPNDIIESGDYGSDMYDASTEINQIYDCYNDSGEMDQCELEPQPDQAENDNTGVAGFENMFSHYFRGNFSLALEQLNFLSGGDEAKKLLYVGKCTQQLGDQEQALHFLMLAFNSSHTDDLYIVCCISELYFRLRNIQEAWAWCERALQINDESALPHFLAARLLHTEGGNRAAECINQLQICILHCPVNSIDQLSIEVVEMWLDVARIAQAMNCDAQLCIRAWLRAVGVARSMNALSIPQISSSSAALAATGRTGELDSIRPAACSALFELGKYLESLAPPSLVDDKATATTRLTSSTSKKRRQLKSAVAFAAEQVAASSVAPTLPPGWGYMRGAYSSYYLCNIVNANSNPVHRNALTAAQNRIVSHL